LTTFGREGARLGFVMPRSVLQGDQYQTFRAGTFTAPFRLDSYWDLLDVTPLFNVPSCVLFASRRTSEAGVPGRLPAREYTARLPSRDLPLSEATQHLQSKDKTARRIYLGSRTALSTTPGRSRPTLPSPYLEHFHQGATIVPRNFYFVTVR